MQVRSLSRNNTMSSLNKKNTVKMQPKANTKKVLQAKDMNKPDNQQQKFIYQDHPSSYLLRGTLATTAQFKKFNTLLYRGLFYSVNNLKGPSQEYLKKKKVKLPQPQDVKQKFLVLDLDQTLIHSVFTNQKTDVKFTFKGDQFKFNVRPYVYQFLQNMSALYTIYVFTAGTQDYAEPIVNYLNQKKKTIHGVLHRKNCMQTHNGFFIKDLRIISNRQLKDIIMIDNLVHSFGLQLENGIPILQYLVGKNDKQLLGLQQILKEIVNVQDIRVYLKDKLNIRSILDHNQSDFITVQNYKQKS